MEPSYDKAFLWIAGSGKSENYKRKQNEIIMMINGSHRKIHDQPDNRRVPPKKRQNIIEERREARIRFPLEVIVGEKVIEGLEQLTMIEVSPKGHTGEL